MIEKLEIEILNTGHITNCYIIFNDNKDAVIVDPADKAEIISDKIKELHLVPRFILLTHAHADHTMAVKKLIEIYNIKVIANINEKDMIASKVNDYSSVFGATQQKQNLDNFIFLKDNELVPFDSMKIRMIHTPGHTKGSVCYYFQDYNILITGDTLFSNCFGRCDLATASIEDMVESLVKLYKNFHNVYIYPGHDESNLKIEDTYEHIRKYLNQKTMIDLNDILN